MSIEGDAMRTVVRLTRLEHAKTKVERWKAEHELAQLRLTISRMEVAMREWESRTGQDGFGFNAEDLGRWLERVKVDAH